VLSSAAVTSRTPDFAAFGPAVPEAPVENRAQIGLGRFAWGVLALNVAVIVWGAFVRASGSGAGCGSHWPTCNGEVVPRSPSWNTIVEFTHRATSGLALLGVTVMFVWTLRATRRGHPARRAAAWSLVFIVVEAVVGAGLVLFEWVAGDKSLARGFVMCAHLINTFLLLGALVLTAWHLGGGPKVSLRGPGRTLFLSALVAICVAGASGGIAALGDTLFPAGSLAEGLAQDLSPTAHVFLELRIFHPVFAVIAAVLVVAVARASAELAPQPTVRSLARAVTVVFAVQLVAGVVNVLLLAPMWMQLLHLAIADGLWLLVVLVIAESRRAAAASPPR
jgi:cytochrome c oxidase assembly protein subunit 15